MLVVVSVPLVVVVAVVKDDVVVNVYDPDMVVVLAVV